MGREFVYQRVEPELTDHSNDQGYAEHQHQYHIARPNVHQDHSHHSTDEGYVVHEQKYFGNRHSDHHANSHESTDEGYEGQQNKYYGARPYVHANSVGNYLDYILNPHDFYGDTDRIPPSNPIRDFLNGVDNFFKDIYCSNNSKSKNNNDNYDKDNKDSRYRRNKKRRNRKNKSDGHRQHKKRNRSSSYCRSYRVRHRTKHDDYYVNDHRRKDENNEHRVAKYSEKNSWANLDFIGYFLVGILSSFLSFGIFPFVDYSSSSGSLTNG